MILIHDDLTKLRSLLGARSSLDAHDSAHNADVAHSLGGDAYGGIVVVVEQTGARKHAVDVSARAEVQRRPVPAVDRPGTDRLGVGVDEAIRRGGLWHDRGCADRAVGPYLRATGLRHIHASHARDRTKCAYA